MPINLFKSLFNQPSAQPSGQSFGQSLSQPTAKFSPSSPRYAYAFQSPYRQPRILILVDNVRATYFLSFHYVLERLHQSESLAFFVLDSAEIDRWTKGHSPEAFVQQVIADVQPTLVIFSRYGVPYGDRLPALFKAQKIATICHIDDDLLNINPALGEEIQKRQGDPVVLRARKILLEQSDLIYASTPFLGDRLASQFPQQTVFSARCTSYLDFLITAQPSPSKHLTVGYMGSKGHQEDLDAIAPEIGRILSEYPQTRFETFGTIDLPEVLKSFASRVRSHPTKPNYAEFLNQLRRLNWSIGLAPLQDTEFNRCKTPSKYMEYTACGIPTIASSGHVYSQFPPETHILSAQPSEWYSKIRQLIDSEPLREKLVANGQAYCAKAFSLDAVEGQIKELIALV